MLSPAVAMGWGSVGFVKRGSAMGFSFDPKAATARSGTALAPPPAPPLSVALVAELVASNLVSIAWAVHEHWSLLMLLWPYWMQSIVIGWYYRKRILSLKRFSTDGFESNGEPVRETPEARRETANFLAMHFGFFHVIYAVFLAAFGFSGALGDTAGLGPGDALAVLVLGGVFAFTQYAEHRRNVAIDRGRRPNIGAMLFLPYLRVVPMHLIIIGGAMLGGGSAAVIVFGALKTVADVGMLILEQRLVAKSAC